MPSVFDIYCASDKGEYFIVEVQVADYKDFFDRSLYYTTFPIRNQLSEKHARRDKMIKEGVPEDELPAMNYKLTPIYVIGILSFRLPFMKEYGVSSQLVYRGQVMDVNNKVVMSNNLNFIYPCMPNMPYGVTEAYKCKTTLEKLAFLLSFLGKYLI